MNNFIRLLGGSILAGGLLFGQGNPSPVSPSQGPPPIAWEQVFVASGSDIVAICYSPSFLDSRLRKPGTAISAISKASAAVVTSVGHGFDTHAQPSVTISGATGTGWDAVNGTFVATVIDADTFSIPVNSSGFGTLGGTVTFVTSAPRTNIAEWAVQKYAYSASVVKWGGWLLGSVQIQAKCSDATAATVVVQ
jgi:hypothetical protein